MSNSTNRRARTSAGVLSVLAAFLLAFQSTGDAFSATTENTGDAFTAGTVTLSDNDPGTAMFPMLNMEPNDVAVGCIEATYSGTLDPKIRTYGAITAGAVSPHCGGGADDVVPYRFTVTLQDNPLAQAKTVTVTFTWEAQNL